MRIHKTRVLFQQSTAAQHCRGILKRTQLANVEKLKDIQENFIKDYLTISNNGGIAVIDNASEYIPLDNKPYTIDEKQLQAVKTKIYDISGDFRSNR